MIPRLAAATIKGAKLSVLAGPSAVKVGLYLHSLLPRKFHWPNLCLETDLPPSPTTLSPHTFHSAEDPAPDATPKYGSG